MMAMAQLLNIRMPSSHELTFLPSNPDMPGVDGKGVGQSGKKKKPKKLIIFVCFLDSPISLDVFFYKGVLQTQSQFKLPQNGLPADCRIEAKKKVHLHSTLSPETMSD